MRRITKLLLVLLTIFISMQLIRPARNKSPQVLSTDFTKLYRVSDSVQSVLQNTCYDCHSNNTVYPWYANIQPVAWILARHIKNGKDKLNFSDFGSYTSRRQISKLKSIANQVKDDEMPISSYKWMHKKANLTREEKVLIIDWMNKKAESLSIEN